MLNRRFRWAIKQRVVQTGLIMASLGTFVVVGANSVAAHHGWSEYDNRKTLNLTGQIQSMGYENPHAVIQLKTSNKVWRVVLAPPSRMQNRGLPKDALQVGKTVKLVGYPHRSDSNEMRAERIVVGEQTVELR